jgi:murein DD-endopeptidase MepM/ murein hydrolase activator NlpD
VVIDHGVIPEAGRVYSIAAHLEAVDPAIELGAEVMAGQVLGELGNRGTNASAQGVRGSADPSLHLHWELFIDNWYLGEGQPANVVAELVATTLCDAAATPGCPAQ